MATPTNISLYRSSDPYENLIYQMITLERQPQDMLKTERSTQERMKLVMKDVDSKVSALHKLMKDFTDTFNSPFRGRGLSLPETKAFSATVSDTAAYGAHSLSVERLASADARISKQLTTSAGDLRTFFNTNGSQTFTVGVAKPTEADPAYVENISVTVNPTGTTNAEILAEIRTAVNTAMDDAVTAGKLVTADKAAASLVNETSATSRLSLRSGKTGYDNRLRFGDSAGGLLAFLEVTNETKAAGAGGGAVTAVGTGETTSELNSRFVLDGLALYRSTNTVSDALDGVTLTLKKAGEGPVEFGVTTDADGVKGTVNDFIKKYNDLLVYIQNKSAVDGTTGVRGDFAGDSTFSGLRYGLRDDLAAAVAGQTVGTPATLADLGITMEKDGTLKLSDEQKLLKAVEKDAGAVESLFARNGTGSANDGFATRLLDRLSTFVGVNGLINKRTDSLNDRIGRLDDRIKDWDTRLTQREDQLRSEFAKLQETLAVLQGQQSNLYTILGY